MRMAIKIQMHLSLRQEIVEVIQREGKDNAGHNSTKTPSNLAIS